MSAPEYIEYTITKTGENSYTMTWTPKLSRVVNVQKNTVCLESEDVDGTKTVQNVELPPTAIATWNMDLITSSADIDALNNGKSVDGFKFVDTSNLAIGGVCYEIEKVVTDS